ncbi:MAG: hypothetical protein IPI48_14260 [bacterium]|nr:hypothetical protein [bacterium]
MGTNSAVAFRLPAGLGWSSPRTKQQAGHRTAIGLVLDGAVPPAVMIARNGPEVVRAGLAAVAGQDIVESRRPTFADVVLYWSRQSLTSHWLKARAFAA